MEINDECYCDFASRHFFGSGETAHDPICPQYAPQILRDKTGRQIELGDVLKVFHFIGRRNKRHYMYKQALGIKMLGSGLPYMMFSHLELDGNHYLEACDGRTLTDYEIVQSIDAKFEDRPRALALPNGDR